MSRAPELVLHAQQLRGLALEQPPGRDAGPGRDDLGDVVGTDLLLDHRRRAPSTAAPRRPRRARFSSAGMLAVERARTRVAEVAVALGALGLDRAAASSSLLELADPVEAGLLLLPPRGERRQLLLPVGEVRAQLSPAARTDAGVGLRSPAPSPPCFSRSTGAPQLVDLDRARSRSPCAAATRPRRRGRSPCRAGSAPVM